MLPVLPLWRATAIGMMVNNVVPARAESPRRLVRAPAAAAAHVRKGVGDDQHAGIGASDHVRLCETLLHHGAAGDDAFAPLAGGRVAAPCVVARELQPERTELLDGEDQAARGADLRDLLDRDERQQRPGAEAAVLLVEEQPEEVVLPEELDDVPGKLVALVDLRRARGDPLAGELTDEIADLALLVVQRLERHA